MFNQMWENLKTAFGLFFGVVQAPLTGAEEPKDENGNSLKWVIIVSIAVFTAIIVIFKIYPHRWFKKTRTRVRRRVRVIYRRRRRKY